HILDRSTSQTITLANNGARIEIPADRVYFAFPSGRLSYDCVTCGAQCCRGHGYNLDVAHDLKRQMAASHTLRFFLDPCEAGAADNSHARTLKPACFFLTDQNACDIQAKHGYDAK